MTSRATWAVLDRCLSVSTTASHSVLCLQAICDPELDWLAVIARANRDCAAPALWSTLARAELCEKLPADVRDYLSLLHLENARRNTRIRQQCIEIGSTLAKVGLHA